MTNRDNISEAARKLRLLRRRARLTRKQLSMLAGMPTTTYQHYEVKFKKKYIPEEIVELIAPILLSRGVKKSDIDELVGTKESFNTATKPGLSEQPATPFTPSSFRHQPPIIENEIIYNPDLREEITNIAKKILKNKGNVNFADAYEFEGNLYKFAIEGAKITERFAEAYWKMHFNNSQ